MSGGFPFSIFCPLPNRCCAHVAAAVHGAEGNGIRRTIFTVTSGFAARENFRGPNTVRAALQHPPASGFSAAVLPIDSDGFFPWTGG